VSAAQAPTPGLLWVTSRPTHPELTEKVFNDWYSNEHIQDLVKVGLADLVVRYKNANATAKWPYLAIYRLPDAAKLRDQKVMGSIAATSQLLPGKEKGSKGGAYKDVMAMDSLAYSRIQTFEGQIAKTGRGKALVTSAMEPANGTDADFDQWYRKQHLDMLRYVWSFCGSQKTDQGSMLGGYRRSTRFQKLDGSTPKYLAIHEFDTTSVPSEIRIVMGTEWAKKVVSAARYAGRDTWEYISETGKGGSGERF
jgi:hypothetical protein